ncbi:MAG: hypothetical protein AVDCRST_MAG80-2323, partial [uncultured Rubrobacteraceae bacterium]
EDPKIARPGVSLEDDQAIGEGLYRARHADVRGGPSLPCALRALPVLSLCGGANGVLRGQRVLQVADRRDRSALQEQYARLAEQL